MAQEFKFVPPPEAPVFRPTAEEFADPMRFLTKIKPIVFRTGIGRIIPPENWSPPFAVDIDKFHFTPRVQRLYELEANSRIKLNFISRLYQFTKLQGGEKLRIPSIAGQYLDVYKLHKCVAQLEGYEAVCGKKLWSDVAIKLGHTPKHASTVKSYYEKLLLAFDLMLNNEQLNHKVNKRTSNNPPKTQSPTKRRRVLADGDIDYTANKELRNLRYFGPGPKAAVPVVEKSTEEGKVAVIDVDQEEEDKEGKAKPKKAEDDPLDTFVCRVCQSGDDEANLLICDTESCQQCFHLYCLNPPLRQVPKCQWQCPTCIRKACTQPTELYGFPQSGSDYTLPEFGIHADNFKSKYFSCRPDCLLDRCKAVPTSVVESEFWRILQEYNDDVVVEYGADIHSSKQGSGFPTELHLRQADNCFTRLGAGADALEEARKYAASPWNLNNLPVLNKSILRFIRGDIDGMKVPWCYVGMVFSSFCWHIEDHWSYSINYNHWGEPKTWYGVSSLYAPKFEEAMRKRASELFAQSPDLLHHITTIMNPNILQSEGVPVYRTDQYAGEFVVTFPRAYHAGFNQGFNFAEAVNFCLPDWLPMGRACVDHYVSMRRQCVFSNEELLCVLAEVAVGRRRVCDVKATIPPTVSAAVDHTAGLDLSAVAIVHAELLQVLNEERVARQRLHGLGVTCMERRLFDELPDDERTCFLCQTTLFLSAFACLCRRKDSTLPPEPRDTGMRRLASKNDVVENTPANTDKLACIKHVDQLCADCPRSSCRLLYYYTLEEMEDLVEALEQKLSSFKVWKAKMATWNESARKLFHEEPLTEADPRFTWKELRENFLEAQAHSFESDTSFGRLNELHDHCRNILHVAGQVVSPQSSQGQQDKLALKIRRLVAMAGQPGRVLFAQQCFQASQSVETKLKRVLESASQNTALVVDFMEQPELQEVTRVLNFTDEREESICEQLRLLLAELKDAGADSSLSDRVANRVKKLDLPEVATSLEESVQLLQRAICPLDPGYADMNAWAFTTLALKEANMKALHKQLVEATARLSAKSSIHELLQSTFSWTAVQLAERLAPLKKARVEAEALLFAVLDAFRVDYLSPTESQIGRYLASLRKMQIVKLFESPADASTLKMSPGSNEDTNRLLDALEQHFISRSRHLLDQETHALHPRELADFCLVADFFHEPSQVDYATMNGAARNATELILLQYAKLTKSLHELINRVRIDQNWMDERLANFFNCDVPAEMRTEKELHLVYLLLPRWPPDGREERAKKFVSLSLISCEEVQRSLTQWENNSLAYLQNRVNRVPRCRRCEEMLDPRPVGPMQEFPDECPSCVLFDVQAQLVPDTEEASLTTTTPSTLAFSHQIRNHASVLTTIKNLMTLNPTLYDSPTLDRLKMVQDKPSEIADVILTSYPILVHRACHRNPKKNTPLQFKQLLKTELCKLLSTVYSRTAMREIIMGLLTSQTMRQLPAIENTDIKLL